MKADKNRRVVVLAALGLLAAFGWDAVGSASDAGSQAVAVTAKVLDLPQVSADGSFRFHVAVESNQPGPPAAAQVSKDAATPLFEDNFDAGKKPEWQDVAGGSNVEDGKLAAASDGNLIVVAGVRQQDVRVSVAAEATRQETDSHIALPVSAVEAAG